MNDRNKHEGEKLRHLSVMRSSSSMSTLSSKRSRSSLRSHSTKPSDRHLRDLNGTWRLSQPLSTGIPPALAIQGYDSRIRRTMIAGPKTVKIEQTNFPGRIFVTRTDGFVGTEKWFPSRRVGEWSSWGFDEGLGRGRCRWTRELESRQQGLTSKGEEEVDADVDSAYGSAESSNASVRGARVTMSPSSSPSSSSPALAKHELTAAEVSFLLEGQRKLGQGTEILEIEIKSEEVGWASQQVWTVEDGGGRLIRRVVTWSTREGEESKRAETRWVYEFEGP